ncbi:MAG: hypothetical protein ACRDJE_04355 [Dehalococcoidia bacterium]
MHAVPSLTAFRHHLHHAASRDLERLDPDWVDTVRAAQHDDAVQRAGPPSPMHDRARFAPYRRLLTLVLELELYLLRYGGIKRFLDVPADAATLGALGLTEDDWAWMLLNQVVVATNGLIDRTERIITASLDVLVGSYNPQRVTDERPQLLKTVGEMREGMAMVGGSIAHSALNPEAGSIGLLLDSSMWEVTVALGEVPDLQRFGPYTNPDPETARARSDWGRRLVEVEVEAVEQSFRDLDAAIDWSRVRAV